MIKNVRFLLVFPQPTSKVNEVKRPDIAKNVFTDSVPFRRGCDRRSEYIRVETNIFSENDE